MTEIKRFVSYIYMYNGGEKGSNVGFAKVDSRNGQCKIAVNIKGLEFSNGKNEKVYLFYRKQEKILGIYIGSFQVVNGVGEFHEQFPTQNIKAANLSLDEMNGIFIREEDRNERVFASGWDDYAILVNQFCVHEGNETSVSNKEESGMLRASEVEEKRKEPVIFFDRNWKSEETEKEPVIATQETESVQEKSLSEEKTVNSIIEIEEAKKEGTKKEETESENFPKTEAIFMQETKNKTEEATVPKTENEFNNDYGQGIEKQKEDLERGIKRGQKMDIMLREKEMQDTDSSKEEEQIAEYPQKEQKSSEVQEPESFKPKETNQIYKKQKSEFIKEAEGVETVIIEDADGERIRKRIHTEDQTETNQQEKENMQKDGLLWGVHTPGVWKEISWEEYQEKEQQLRKQVQTCVFQNKQKQDMTEQEDFAQLKKEWKGESSKQQEKQEVESPKTQDMQKLSDESNLSDMEETAWEKLCHQFPKIRAFVDKPECICLKIDLQDLRMLSQENWVLGSNSFLLHGYYNFRYLILTQEEEFFVLGVPGIYHPNEKMMASMFGFGDFKPVKDCDKLLGQFGYWCKKVKL